MDATFKSGRNLAIATAVLLGTMAFVEISLAIGQCAFRGPVFSSDGIAWVATLALLGLWHFVTWIGTVVLFSMWVYRATANLPALGAVAPRFTPSGAVWAYFIPFVNLVRGYQVMSMIWSESQPRAMTDSGFLKPPSAAIVSWWWTLLIGSRALGWVATSYAQDLHTGLFRGDGPSSLLPTMDAVFLLATATAAILCAVMVLKADARQREQAIDLERRASVPRPTGMELR
jgi:hypothetical protein